MGLKQELKHLFYKSDFFHTKELLRHKHETQYRTVCGGVSSVIIVLALLGIFYQKVYDTFDRALITATLNNVYSMQPTPLTISTYEQGKFMLALQVMNMNLNDQKRYFNVQYINRKMRNGAKTDNPEQNIHYPMQPCTRQHWKHSDEALKSYDYLNISQWRCLPINKTYDIRGKYASQYWNLMQFRVKKCQNQSNQINSCAPQQQIDALFQEWGTFSLTIYFSNPLINPTQRNYLQNYLEDKYYITFSKKFGGEGSLYMQDFTIKTDQSILPYTEQKIQRGSIITDAVVKDMYQSFGDVYASFVIFKSAITKDYERRYYKVDELFSYIGGLFQTIVLLLFLVSVYNNYSLQVSLGGFLFNHQHKKLQEGNIFKNYNFFQFLIHGIYNFFDMLGHPPNWKVSKQFYKCRQEMIRQLDIQYLIRRIIFLENFMKLFLEKHQIKGLFLQQKITIDEARKTRRFFKLRKRIGNRIKDIESKYREESNSFGGNDQSFNMFPSKVMNSFDIETNKGDGNQSPSITKLKKKNSKLFTLFKRPSLKQKPEVESDSESLCSSDSEESLDETTVIQEISNLKEQAEQGDYLSKKIWDKIDTSIKNRIGVVINEDKLNHSEQKKGNRRFKTEANDMFPAISINQMERFPQPLNSYEDNKTENLRETGYRKKVKDRYQQRNQIMLIRDFQGIGKSGQNYGQNINEDANSNYR